MNQKLARLKLLHTSDWHLGRTLHGRNRYEEFEAFLTWLAETIQQNEIDALLVAGDVFDTNAPKSRSGALLPFPMPGGHLILSSLSRATTILRPFSMLPRSCSKRLTQEGLQQRTLVQGLL